MSNNGGLQSMLSFDGVYPEVSQEIKEVERRYEQLIKEAPTDKKIQDLVNEMYAEVGSITDQLFKNLPKISSLNDLYRWWIAGKPIKINKVVYDLFQNNVIDLVLRGLVEEKTGGYEGLMIETETGCVPFEVDSEYAISSEGNRVVLFR